MLILPHQQVSLQNRASSGQMRQSVSVYFGDCLLQIYFFLLIFFISACGEKELSFNHQSSFLLEEENNSLFIANESDNSIAFLSGIVEENKKVLEENKKVLEEKEKVLEEKYKALEENKKALEEKNRLIQELAQTLLSAGLPIAEVSKKTGLSPEELERL